MKKRILTVISVMGLALMLSSCAYLGYELTEAEQADLGVGPMAASQQVEANGAAGEAEDQDADEGQAGQGEDADGQDSDSQGDEDADGGAGEDANADDQSADEDANADVSGGADDDAQDAAADYVQYYFRSDKLLNSHYEKHGIEMGFASAKEYEKAASDVVNNPNALHKIEAEDGDDVYYVEDTNEFVVVSTDGYIRTYFNPGGGIDYYNRQ